MPELLTDPVTTPRRTEALKHFVRFDQPGANGRLAMAVCGELIDPRTQFAALPTCPVCAEWVRESDDAEI